MYTSKDIAKHTAEFLARGGVIRTFDNEGNETTPDLLVYKATGKRVQIGDVFDHGAAGNEETTKMADRVMVMGFTKPHKPASSGRVYVEWLDGSSGEYFPHVFGMEFINRSDR